MQEFDRNTQVGHVELRWSGWEWEWVGGARLVVGGDYAAAASLLSAFWPGLVAVWVGRGVVRYNLIWMEQNSNKVRGLDWGPDKFHCGLGRGEGGWMAHVYQCTVQCIDGLGIQAMHTDQLRVGRYIEASWLSRMLAL